MKTLSNFPFFSQRDNWLSPGGACNATSIAMCLAYFGLKGDGSYPQLEDQVYVRSMKLGNPGDAGVMKRVVESYPGCTDTYYSAGDLGDIRKFLDQGKPVVAHTYLTKPGHIIAVYGYDDRGFFVNDPWGEVNAATMTYPPNGGNGKGLHFSNALMAACASSWSWYECQSRYAHFKKYPKDAEGIGGMWLHGIWRSR